MCKKLIYLTSFVLLLFLASNAFSVDDPLDMADSSGDIKSIEAWADEGNLHLTMTVYGVFAPSVEDTPADMTNRYYYHWLLDTDNNPDTGYFNNEYEGNPTNLETPIGVDVLVQFGWRDGATNGVYAYSLDLSTGDEVELFQDYEYTIDGDTIHAVIPLEDLGLDPGQTIAVSAYQEGASNDWQVDWVESFELTLTVIEKTVLFAEDFEGLVLGPNVDEAVAGDAVWTDTPPEGWVVDESGIPGIGMDATDGVTEWAGWAFADKAWWIEAAEDQDRSLFELGSGIVAVADPDEWDDDERLPIPITADPYDTWLTTPEIDIADAEAGTLELKFDSSWRPEFDDNLHQTANITASFDGGEPVVVMLWESDETSANYKDYATNETVIIKLDKPEGAKKLVLTFGLFDAGNDWWWAIDNIEVRGIVPDLGPVNPGAGNLVHSWTFDDGTADDVVGDAEGTLVGDAAVVDGQLVLDGDGDWMDMPGDIIAMNTYEGLTIEIMFTSVAGGNTGFHMVTAFGEEGTGANTGYGYKYICITPARGDDVSRAMIQTVSMDSDPWTEETGVSDVIEHDDGLPHHMVCTVNDTELAYYIDGVLIGTAALDPPGNSIAGLGTDVAHIGKGVYGVDPLWAGSVDYLNLYNRALSEQEVRYLAGERATPVDPGSDGLLAWWACDEGEGTVVGDVSGNGRDGTFVNGDPAWVDGIYGNAVELVGPTLIEVPPLDMELSEATMAGWIKPNGPQPDWSALIMTRDPGLATGFNVLGYQLAYHWNDTSSSWSFRGGDMIAEDDWTFVAVTIEPDKATFYVNGEQGSVNEIAHEPCLWNSNIYLGGDGNESWIDRRMNGALDEVVMYDRALSAGEIRYLAGIREYTFNGDALDDTWDHDNGSDQWDGTGPGEGNPGGVALLSEDGADFLRIQDTGDPRDYDMGDPGSNRKIYLTRLTDISLDGLKLEVSLRVATSAPLDDQHPDGGAGVAPWPAEGIGYHIRDDGKGMVGVSDGVGIISFSLAKAGEIEGIETDALVMNNLVGTEPSGDVDSGDAATAANSMVIDDATQWNTFVIDIAAGGAGTHIVTVSANGGAAESFEVTTGGGLEAEGPFIAIGSSGTGGITAFDVDYLSVSN
jgi:hypothetical protein